MAKKHQHSELRGSVGQDVEAAHASADPASWAQRYQYDAETNRVVPRNQGAVLPAVVSRAQVQKGEDGSMTVSLPELATASFPAMSMWGMSANGLDLDYFALWDSVENNNDGKIDIRRAIRHYRTDPVAMRCINLLADLANSRLNIICEDETTAELINNWRKKAMPHSFIQNWFVEYFKVQWVISYKTLIDYVPKDYKNNKIPRADTEGNIVSRALANTGIDPETLEQLSEEEVALLDAGADVELQDREVGNVEAEEMAAPAVAEKTVELLQVNADRAENYKKALAAYETARAAETSGIKVNPKRMDKLQRAMASAQAEWLKGQIPGAYTLLDPMLVNIEGPREMPMLRQPFLNIGGDLLSAINAPTPITAPIINALPIDIVEQARRGAVKVWLSPNVCNMTFGDKAPYERYPTPLLKRAFSFLDNKQELVAMDRATARAVKERILLVKLGNDEYPVFDDKKLAQVQGMFNTPSKNMVLVWNHCIELEWIQPDLSNLLDEKKYEVCDNQTRIAFGINNVLIGSGDASGTVNVLNFEGVKEIVDEAQGKFLEFFLGEVDMLRAALSISKTVNAAFDKLNLQDAVKYWAVLAQAVMNGLVDQQTALETLGFHFPTIVARMKKMKTFKNQGLFMPMPSANNLGPSGSPLPAKGGTPAAGGKGGKPANAPLADNNANRKGKMKQPKAKPAKAKAKIQPVDDKHVAVVIDLPDLDDGQVQDVVDRFGVDPQWVMTKATYEQKYGPILMFTPWPDLSAAEAMACIRDTVKLGTKIDAETEKAVARHKSSSAGKRGHYLTDKVKEELAEASIKSVLVDYLPKLAGEEEDVFAAHLTSSIASLEATDPEMSQRDVRISAAVLCAKRYAKAKAVAAQPPTEEAVAAEGDDENA
jgi:hypothetical protein